jgi:hypothetical protein
MIEAGRGLPILMAKPPKIKLPRRKQFRRFVSKLNEEDTFRFHYCYQLGSTFVLLNKMEDAIIHSMSMCDRVKVKTVLGADATNWERCRVVANVSVAQQGDGFRKCSTHPAGYGLSEKKPRTMPGL